MELFAGVIYADAPFEPNVRVNDIALVPSEAHQTDSDMVIDSLGNIYLTWRDLRESTNGDIYFAKSNDGGNTFLSEIKVNDDGVDAIQSSPSIAVDNLGKIYITWVDDRYNISGDIYFSASIDGGNTFSINNKINDDSENDSQEFPSIAVDNLGRIFIVWSDNRSEEGDNRSDYFDIYIANSSDGGNTFSVNKMVNDVDIYHQYYPSITIDDSNNIYVAWCDNRSDRDLDIYFAKSTDGGNIFSTSQRVIDEIGDFDQTEPTIAVDDLGNIYVAWLDMRNSITDIYFAKSTNGGSTFSANLKINDDIIGAWQSNPDIASYGSGFVYLTWIDNRSGDYDIYFSSSSDFGNTFLPNKRVNDDPGANVQMEPCIALDDSGIIHAVWTDHREGNYDIYFTKSTDGGATFSSNIKCVDLISDANQYDPIVVADGFGNIYTVWTDNRNGDYDIYFSKSSDGGSTFSTDLLVNDNFGATMQYEPAMALDDVGNIYLAWKDERDEGYGDIYFSKSTDGGTTFSANIQVNDELNSIIQADPSLVVDSIGNIFIVWRDNRLMTNDIFFARSTDGGASFSVDKRINDDTWIAGHYDPHIAVDDADNIFVVWWDDRAGDYDIYLTYSLDSGDTFSTNKKVNDDPGSAIQKSPSIAAGNAGNIFISWEDRRNGDGDIYFTRSTNYGNSFSPNLKINDDLQNKWQNDPFVTIDDAGNIYIIWMDKRNRNYDIYFAHSTDGGVTFSENVRVNDDISGSLQLNPSMTVDNNGNIFAVWEDKRNANSDVYFCRRKPLLDILITEVQDGPDGSEWLEVYNPALAPINLPDYKISLDSGASFLVGTWSNPTINFGEYSIWTPTSTGVLNDEGASISIHNFTHMTKPMYDIIGYGQNGIAPDPLTGESSARLWDSDISKFTYLWARNGSSGTTPGASNNAPGVNIEPEVILNEVCFNPLFPQYGFIEIIYTGKSSVDISNYKIVCDSVYTIPSLTFLSNNHRFYGLGQPDNPVGFDLDDGISNGDNVYLYDDTGVLLDMVGWSSSHIQGTSVLRMPDGNGTYQGYNDTTSEAAGWFFNVTLKVLMTEISDSSSAISRIEIYNPRYPLIDFTIGYSFETSSSGTLAGVWTISSTDKGEHALFEVSTPNALDPEGDDVRLYLNGVLVEEISYGQKGTVPDPLAEESTARYWDFVQLVYTNDWTRNSSSGPSWGILNDVVRVSTQPELILNEVRFYPLLPQYGFIELVYIGDKTLDISNYRIVCDSEYRIPQGVILSKVDPYYGIIQPYYPVDFDLDDGVVNGDNVYLYDDSGELLDMVGWNSSHAINMTVSRVPSGFGTYQGFNDISSEDAGWRFDTVPSFSLLYVFPDYMEQVELGGSITYNLTISNKQRNNDIIDITNISTPWGIEVIILDENGNPLNDTNANGIPDINISMGGKVNLTVIVTVTTLNPHIDIGTVIITVQSTFNPLWIDNATLINNLYPYITPDKTVSPKEINILGNGYGEQATITLNASGNGVGLIAGVDTDITDANPMIRDVLPSWIDYIPGSFSVPPDSIYTDARDYTILEWNVSSIDIDESWNVSFNITSSMFGWQLTNDVQTSRVNYTNWNNEPVTVLFPETRINVISGEPSPPKLSIQVVSYGGGDDIKLSWITSPQPNINHYLIYKSHSQTEFDFGDVWIDTSSDPDPVDGLVIPLRTTFNHTNSALPGHANYNRELYYIVRAVNSKGEISDSSRTVGKWTTVFPKDTSTFSLPLAPLYALDTFSLINDMKANYIKWIDPNSHNWRQHNLGDPMGINNTPMNVGRGYEVNFPSQTKYTFCGMPGAMILYDNNSFGFDTAPGTGDVDSLTATVDSATGTVTLNWVQPDNIGSDDVYYVLRSETRDGFWGEVDLNYTILAILPYTDLSFQDIGNATEDSEYYYMIVPVNESTGEIGISSYSIGVYTIGYSGSYDSFALPLKPNGYNSADWFCDVIDNTAGINYFNITYQLWYWHSTGMQEGAFDVIIEMGIGYQISTSGPTKFTFIGV